MSAPFCAAKHNHPEFSWLYCHEPEGHTGPHRNPSTRVCWLDDRSPNTIPAEHVEGVSDILESRSMVTKFEVDAQTAIRDECAAVRDLLIEKNRKYGNSALDPVRVFSKASAVEQILVRIDDKLSRIRTTGLEGADEDTVQDLIGYLILLKVAKKAGK